MSSQTRYVKRRESYTTFPAFSVPCERIERLRENVQLRDHRAKLPIFIFFLFFSLLDYIFESCPFYSFSHISD